MKNIIAFIFLLLGFLLTLRGQDTVRRNQIIINTYPSNLLVGDISIGIEHLYRKRLSHEFMFFYKVFSPETYYYKYNKGFRLNYLIKCNFINRKYFRMSGNMSFVYKKIYFHDKEDYWFEKLSTDLGPIKTYTFLMDRQIKNYGLGIGFGMNFRVSHRISIGNDFMFEILNTQKSYTVKKSIKGEMPSYYELSIPTAYVSKYYITYHLFPILKISYHL